MPLIQETTKAISVFEGDNFIGTVDMSKLTRSQKRKLERELQKQVERGASYFRLPLSNKGFG